MDSKTLIYSKRALLDSITIYIHFIKGHLNSKQTNSVMEKLMPIRKIIVKSIKENSNVVLDHYQTSQLLMCLILSAKITKDQQSKTILDKTIDGIQKCFIRSSAFPSEARRTIVDLEKRLQL